MTRARPLFVAVAAALALFVVSAGAAAAAPFKSKYALAGRCVTLRSVAATPAGVFYMKAAALGTYLLYDQNAQLVTATPSGVARTATATTSSEWRATGPDGNGAFQLHSSHAVLAAAPGGGLGSLQRLCGSHGRVSVERQFGLMRSSTLMPTGMM